MQLIITKLEGERKRGGVSREGQRGLSGSEETLFFRSHWPRQGKQNEQQEAKSRAEGRPGGRKQIGILGVSAGTRLESWPTAEGTCQPVLAFPGEDLGHPGSWYPLPEPQNKAEVHSIL